MPKRANAKPYDRPGFRAIRDRRVKRGALDDEPCCRCGQPIRYDLPGSHPLGPTADHLVPLVEGGELLDESMLGVSHLRCNSAHGARLNHEAARKWRESQARFSGDTTSRPDTKASTLSTLPEHPEPEATGGHGSHEAALGGARTGPGAAGPGRPHESPYVVQSGLAEPYHGAPWDNLRQAEPYLASMPWLQAVVESMPPEAVWPRVMSGKHPDAVGTLGYEAIEWIEARRAADTAVPTRAKRLRWFQRLVLVRLLEVDADGLLVWESLLLSTSRQIGKSVLLREIALWRASRAEHFGEPQLVLHTAKDLNVCEEVQRPARKWTEATGHKVVYSNGKQELTFNDGSRWAIRSTTGVYGYSSSTGIVDEAWGVSAAVVDDGIEPTMAEREQPQLLLISTAHREATPLFPTRRRVVLSRLLSPEPDDDLLIEWSSDPTREAADIEGWREASPHWTPRRQRVVAAKYGRAGFDEQWRNVWPDAAGDRSWLTVAAWSNAQIPMQDLVGDVAVSIVPDSKQEWFQVVAAAPTADGTVVAVHLGAYRTLDLALVPVKERVSVVGSRVTVLVPRVLRGRVTKPEGAVDLVILGLSDLAAAATTARAAINAGWLKVHGPAEWGAAVRTAVTRREGDVYRISDKLSPGPTEPASALVAAAWWASRKDRPVAWVV